MHADEEPEHPSSYIYVRPLEQRSCYHFHEMKANLAHWQLLKAVVKVISFQRQAGLQRQL